MFSKLGRFEIKDVIGRGAMGEVYLGVDPVLGREVAIKTIISSALPEDQARQRFDREAKAAAVLNSPNIVTIHELGEDQGVLFIAMERLKGQDLEQILLQRSLSLVESLEVLAQVCDGLDVAHRHHIIHRDIKPSNIMVMREGRKLLAKLMDFGVARLKDSAMTMKGTVVGTVNYIAPEYIRSGEPDARSDLFAVGVMLYECISGRKPFEGGSASTVLFKIVNDPPDPLDLPMLQGLSPALRNMTERSLAKDPDERFQSAEEFALALRAAKDPAWNGKVEETTVRMKIRPLEPPPLMEPPSEPAAAVPGTGGNGNPAATAAKDITQDLPVPPELTSAPPEPPAMPGPESYKTISIQLPNIPKAAPKPVQPDLARTQVLSLPAASTPKPQAQPVDAVLPPPPAPKTEILQLPPAAASAGTDELVVPPLPAPKTEILQLPPAAASAGTDEFVVPPLPAPKTEILQLPPAAASAGTDEFVVPPLPAPKTEILQLPPAAASAGTDELVVPPLPAPKTEILQLPPAAASAGTDELVVPPLPAPKTEILQLPPAAASAGTDELVVPPLPAPKTEILQLPPAAASAGTDELVVSPLPAPKTEILQLPPAAASAGTDELVVPPLPAPKTEILQLPPVPISPSMPLEVVPVPPGDAIRTKVELLPVEPAPASNVVQEGVAELAPKSPRKPGPAEQAVCATVPAAVQLPIPELPLAAQAGLEGEAEEAPIRSSRGLVFALLGLIGLAVLGGAGYFIVKFRAAQTPSVASPAPAPVEAAPPPSIPTPVAPVNEAPVPIPEPPPVAIPAAVPAKPVKAPKKAVPATKTPAPIPAPEPVAAPAPPPPVVTAPPPPPPPPPVDPKKKWAEESAKKKQEQEDRSKK